MDLSPFHPALLVSNAFLKMYLLWSVVPLQPSLQPLLAGSELLPGLLCSWRQHFHASKCIVPTSLDQQISLVLAMLKAKNKELFLSFFIAEETKAQRGS